MPDPLPLGGMYRIPTFLLLLVAASACTSPAPDDGLSYDPPGSTVTDDKPVTLQERYTRAVDGTGVTFTTAFEGARLNDVAAVGEGAFRATIRPENAPVNNSAWYAFQVSAEAPRTITVELTYEEGDHRYLPKLSRDGKTWAPIEPSAFAHDTTDGTARLTLQVTPEPLWVAGQELITSRTIQAWSDSMATRPFVTQEIIGTSRGERPIRLLTITEDEAPSDYVLVIARQHPPEVPGQLAALTFLEAVNADTELARAFRQRYAVLAVPMVNPDGADEGHWRHNLGGIDLNRDWGDNFNQQETQLVRDTFLQRTEGGQVVFTLDFHSTQEDVFYTLARDLETVPPGFTDDWLDAIRAALPDYEVVDEPFGLGAPVSKNWFYETFQAPSITYEVGDEQDRGLLRDVSQAAAEGMMQLLIELR
ncbi:MAG: M14 family zinc carboxypeptidase [Bacteroidota bacterium]